MRIYEMESYYGGGKLNPSAVSKFIIKNCSDAYNTYLKTGEVLYRIVAKTNHIFIGSFPNNRVPVDTPKQIQDLIDNYLQQEGFTALRNNSVFCSPSYFSLGRYEGNGFVIFPFNGFSFTYSEVFEDFTEDITGPMDIYKQKTWDIIMDNLRALTPQEFVSKYKFKHDSFEAAMKSGNEIYIHGKYLAITRSAPFLKTLLGFSLITEEANIQFRKNAIANVLKTADWYEKLGREGLRVDFHNNPLSTSPEYIMSDEEKQYMLMRAEEKRRQAKELKGLWLNDWEN